MQQISTKFQNLVDDVRSAERTLEAVRKLSVQGSNFRIRLVVDHPDEELCALLRRWHPAACPART